MKKKTESRYLRMFEKLSPEDLRLRGNRLLVELLPQPEITTKGGLVVATSLSEYRTSVKDNAADVAVVLSAGEGYYSEETGEPVSMDIKQGNVVLISRFGARVFSQFAGLNQYTSDTIALIRDSDVNCAWDSMEAFDSYVEKINDGVE